MLGVVRRDGGAISQGSKQRTFQTRAWHLEHHRAVMTQVLSPDQAWGVVNEDLA